MADLLDASLRDFLDTLAGEGPAPAGGSAAAVVVAMGAGLVGMVARASRKAWPDAGGVVAQAEALRARVSPLAQADAEAYGAALNAIRQRAALEPRYRDQQLAAALDRAAEIPMQIAEAGSDVASLAALVAERGNAEVRADAAVAALLAEGGCRAAAKLVAVSLAARGDDDRVRRARQLVEHASEAARRAVAASE